MSVISLSGSHECDIILNPEMLQYLLNIFKNMSGFNAALFRALYQWLRWKMSKSVKLCPLHICERENYKHTYTRICT